jgi:hypothetical protein
MGILASLFLIFLSKAKRAPVEAKDSQKPTSVAQFGWTASIPNIVRKKTLQTEDTLPASCPINITEDIRAARIKGASNPDINRYKITPNITKGIAFLLGRYIVTTLIRKETTKVILVPDATTT